MHLNLLMCNSKLTLPDATLVKVTIHGHTPPEHPGMDFNSCKPIDLSVLFFPLISEDLQKEPKTSLLSSGSKRLILQ